MLFDCFQAVKCSRYKNKTMHAPCTSVTQILTFLRFLRRGGHLRTFGLSSSYNTAQVPRSISKYTVEPLQVSSQEAESCHCIWFRIHLLHEGVRDAVDFEENVHQRKTELRLLSIPMKFGPAYPGPDDSLETFGRSQMGQPTWARIFRMRKVRLAVSFECCL